MSNQKDAANIAVGLSTQLINASLTLIALSGAFFTFILDKKNPTVFFYVCYILAFVFLILSIIFGGSGIARVKKEGEGGTWQTSGTPDWFNFQAIALLFGIFSIFMLPFTGDKKDDGISETEAARRSSAKTDSLLMENIKLLKDSQKDTDSTINLIIRHQNQRAVNCTPHAKDQIKFKPK